LKPCAGYETRYGWQDLHLQKYPGIGSRLMASCEVLDLDLLPEKYDIKKIRFSAGMENPIVHLGIWTLSWAARAGFPFDLSKHSAALLAVSNWFDFPGSADGGMHVILEGKDKAGNPISTKWFVIALDGDGPCIPTVPAVVLTRKILTGQFRAAGGCLASVWCRWRNTCMNLKTSESKHMSRHQYRELHSRGLIVPKFALRPAPPSLRYSTFGRFGLCPCPRLRCRSCRLPYPSSAY
jgi:hypothetical protein